MGCANKIRFWKVSVTEKLDRMVEEAISQNTHITKSEFVREAVRQKLSEIGLFPQRYVKTRRGRRK